VRSDLPADDPESLPPSEARWLPVALCLLAALPLLGAFLPGPAAWGFNHLAYLPRWMVAPWGALVALLIWPRSRRVLDRALGETAPRVWLSGPMAWGAFVLAFAALCALLRQRSFFLGDGYLIGELVEKQIAFRAFDNLDYLAHLKLYQWLKLFRPIDSFALYRIGAVVAGVVFWIVVGGLAKRLDWAPWRKALLFGLFLTAGPIQLFFGYVESYAFLYVCLTGFLLSGYLSLEKRIAAWVPGLFFGLALAFHLTALFSAPALLLLAWSAPRTTSGRRRWLEVLGPPLLLFAISALLHIWDGYDATWFKREFTDSKNAKSILLPLFGERSLFSAYHWKDLLQLALITSPAALLLAAARARWIWAGRREGPMLFLLAQIASVLGCVLFIDRKLGGARDWDLMAAHVGGLLLLAAASVPDARTPRGSNEPRASRASRARQESGRGGSGQARPAPVVATLALGAGLVSTSAWVVLNHWEERAIARFVDIASDFPAFARAYAYEEVGKYYRKAGDFPRAEQMYEFCVEAYPNNPRFRVLLGSTYTMTAKMAEAEREFRAALERDPDYVRGLENLGKLMLVNAQHERDDARRRVQLGEAARLFGRLTVLSPNDATFWEALAYSSLETDDLEKAEQAYLRANQLNRKLRVHHSLGAVRLGLGKYLESAASFREAIRRGEGARQTQTGLVLALLGAAREALVATGTADAALLDEAEQELARLDAARSGDPIVVGLRERAELLRRRIDPDRGGSVGSPAPSIEGNALAPGTSVEE